MTHVVPDRLLRLDVRCPKCRSYPRLRIPASQWERYRDDPPDMVIQYYECHVKRQGERCNERYPITAGAFHRAA
ncbi:hypothetical protein LCGC14_1446670 [marine sediment metagenome]|uniref:Uncharacterized protein n=1 Tax=marine sediment metagenome TaxID=412755 RepID=A0A0F9JJS9_9ZZZZ